MGWEPRSREFDGAQADLGLSLGVVMSKRRAAGIADHGPHGVEQGREVLAVPARR